MDCGAQTIMFPGIESAKEAAHAVASTRYPQGDKHGIRSISSVVRAGTYGLDRNYTSTANAQASVIVQVESPKGFANIAAIAATEGVDCIFVGTADFAANMGHLGNAGHTDVQSAIAYITAVCSQHRKAVGSMRRTRRWAGATATWASISSRYIRTSCGSRAAPAPRSQR